jgi:acyl-CoA synthetase (AMP-forming)/AMP-acid ligase II
MLADLAELPSRDTASLASLRLIYYGAGRTDAQLIRTLAERHPHIAFAQGWGATETTGSVTMLTPADHRRALASEPDLLRTAGRALPGVDVQIQRDDAIAVRCDGLLLGTLEPDGVARPTLDDGYLVTGDLGHVDAAGYLHVAGRRDDAIKSGGLIVMPARVEEALLADPRVAEAAVFGAPDRRLGEAVTAYIVAVAGAHVDVEELRRLLRSRLGGFECPRIIRVVPHLPRSKAGQVDRPALRALERSAAEEVRWT